MRPPMILLFRKYSSFVDDDEEERARMPASFGDIVKAMPMMMVLLIKLPMIGSKPADERQDDDEPA